MLTSVSTTGGIPAPTPCSTAVRRESSLASSPSFATPDFKQRQDIDNNPHKSKENDPPRSSTSAPSAAMLSAEKQRRSLEPSAHVVSKVNSILFKLDQGPASNLLGDAVSDHVLVVNQGQSYHSEYPGEDEDRPPPTSEIRFPNPAIADYHFTLGGTGSVSQLGSSPYQHHLQQHSDHDINGISPPRSVHFDSSLATSYVLDEEIVQLRHTAAIVAGLQKRLKAAKEELANERANRKRKEKNLIKLAKEMNSRARDHAANDKKIDEMEESIADLEGRLAQKSQEIPRLQSLLDQKEMAMAECQARSERQLVELQQAKQDAARARQELIDVVTSQQQQHNKALSTHRPVATPDQKMVEMEETIEDLEGRLALYQKQEVPRLQRLCDQKEMALAECHAVVDRQRAELHQAKQEAARARQELMDVITSQQSGTGTKIVAMEACVVDLERQLMQYKSVELPRLQLLIEQKEMALCECQARSDRQLLELQLARADASTARQELIEVITSQQSQPRYMTPTTTMDDSGRDSVLSSTGVADDNVTKSIPPMVLVEENGVGGVTSVQQVLFYVVGLLALSIAFLRSSYVHHDVLDMACAPLPPYSFIPPGRRQNHQNTVRTFRAPYWVPELYKREVFAVLCPGRGQTEIQQVNWKVEVLRDGKRMWKGRAGGGFRVEQDKVVLLGRQKDKVVHEVRGPWTLGQSQQATSTMAMTL